MRLKNPDFFVTSRRFRLAGVLTLQLESRRIAMSERERLISGLKQARRFRGRCDEDKSTATLVALSSGK